MNGAILNPFTPAAVPALLGLIASLVSIHLSYRRSLVLAWEPTTSRWAGGITLGAAVVTPTALVLASIGSRPWSWIHVVLICAVLTTVFAIALQWPTLQYRFAIGALSVLCVPVVLAVGAHEAADDLLANSRAAVVRLDGRLTGTATQSGSAGVQLAIAGVCTASSGRLTPAGLDPARAQTCAVTARPRPGGYLAAARDAARGRAEVEVRLAELELAAFAGQPADRAPLVDAVVAARIEQSRLPPAVASFGGLAPLDLLTTIGRSGAAAFAIGGGVPWAVSIPVWVVVAVLLVFFLRWLEIVNARLETGPVEFETNDDERGALLRRAVLLNLPEPGIQPGAPPLTGVTNLAAVKGVANEVVSAIVSFLGTVGVPRRGYVVTLVVPAAATGGAARRNPVVTVRSRRTGTTLATLTTTLASVDDAVTELGFRAAGFMIGRAVGIPPWLGWPTDTAAVFAARDKPKTASKDGVDERAPDHRSAPGNAQLLVQHGYELLLKPSVDPHERADTTEQARRAFRRAMNLWSDFQLARYRLAISLAGDRRETDGYEPTEAKILFDGLIRDLSWWMVLIRKLSVRERGAVVRWNQRSERLLEVRLAAEMHRVAHRSSFGAVDTELAAEAERSRSAFAHYNLACVLVRARQPGAGEALERALTCSDVGEISVDWLKADPDLAELRGKPVFKLFVPDPEEEADSPGASQWRLWVWLQGVTAVLVKDLAGSAGEKS